MPGAIVLHSGHFGAVSGVLCFVILILWWQSCDVFGEGRGRVHVGVVGFAVVGVWSGVGVGTAHFRFVSLLGLVGVGWPGRL